MITWKFNSPTLNADSEFAVTALSEGFSAQVILTWSLQVTALSKGWHRACRFLNFLEDANSEFSIHCLIWELLCLGHTDLKFAGLIHGLTQDMWGWQGSQWRLVLSEYATAAGVCCSMRGRSVDTGGMIGMGSWSWEVVQTLTGALKSCSWRVLCFNVFL